MKRLILILIIALPVTLLAQSILPDHTWHDPASASHSKWFTRDFGSTAFSYNGRIYAFNYYDEGSYKGAFTYVFTINKNNDYGAMLEYKLGPSRTNKLTFGFKNEDKSFYPGTILGKTFCFQFNNRMWYFQHVHNAESLTETIKDESYECFALFPPDTLQSCTTYYNTFNPPPDIIKLGAFQYDSCLYFIGIRQISDDGYEYWYIQEYGFNSSNNRFSHVKDMQIAQIPSYHNMLGGIIKQIDKDGNEYIVFNTFMMGGAYTSKIWILTPFTGDSGTEFRCSSFVNNTLYNLAAMTMVDGTIKGNRTSDANQYYSDRFTSFSISIYKNSDGIHPISAMEIGVDDCQGECPVFSKSLYTNYVTIPVSTAPSQGAGDYFQMVGTYELVPEVYTQAFGGAVDGYQQNVWIFYPDANNHWNGVVFTSDRWRLTNDSIVSSMDLHNKELYPGIDSLWSLIGICDGGPPISIDWEVWESHHTPGTDPTELKFTMESGEESEIQSTYEDQWSVGESLEISKHVKKLETSFGEEFKYSNSYKNVITRSSEVYQTLSIPFALMESNQDTAVLVWAVPGIIRYPFSAFPWWDTDLTNPVPYTFQYMFRVSALSIIEENVGIDEFPFNIEDPNAEDMADWKAANRPEINYSILNQGAQPIKTPTWTNNQEGQTFSYEITDNISESYEHASKYEVSAEVGVALPKVFKLSGNASYEVSYSTETKVTNIYGSSIDCDLTNLKTNQVGPNVTSLNLGIYWYRNVPDLNGDDPNWWYWSAYGDQKPWYIAYINNNTKESIRLLSPPDGDQVSKSDLYFSWLAEPGDIDKYTLVIANSSCIYNGTIIYQQSVGKAGKIILSGFQPEKGKTYFWAVRGFTEDGQLVCSDIGSFTLKDEQMETNTMGLKAVVYPNPGNSGEINIAIDPVSEGKILVRLIDINGALVAAEEVNATTGLVSIVSFPGLHLPAGIYLAVIRSDNEQVVKKVVVR